MALKRGATVLGFVTGMFDQLPQPSGELPSGRLRRGLTTARRTENGRPFAFWRLRHEPVTPPSRMDGVKNQAEKMRSGRVP
jgi:hypothetical protein